MNRTPSPSPPPSSPGCCIAEGAALQIPAEIGVGPLGPLWAAAAASSVLLCTVVPASLRFAMAVATWRAVLRLVPAPLDHGRGVTLRSDDSHGWSLVGGSRCRSLQLRRAVRVPWVGWLLEFVDESGPLWLRVAPRALDRRGARLLACRLTAERT